MGTQAFLDGVINLEQGQARSLGEQSTDRGFARAGHSDEDDEASYADSDGAGGVGELGGVDRMGARVRDAVQEDERKTPRGPSYPRA